MLNYSTILTGVLTECFAAQVTTVADWHAAEPQSLPLPYGASGAEGMLLPLILNQHLMNFRLWHVEDIARRKDISTDSIADCKYRIDTLNQQRNDCIEQIDGCLLQCVTPHLPEIVTHDRPRYNTESLGMAVDRLSILALKIYHMEEQTQRTDVDAAHSDSCRKKLAVLQEQRQDLAQSVFDLVDDFISGYKRPKLYFQFKMYNDPALNPELYKNK